MNDRVSDTVLKRKTTADKVVEAMRRHPVGHQFRAGQLAVMAGVSLKNFATLLAPSVRAGRIVAERVNTKSFLYSLPEVEPVARKSPPWRRAQQRMADPTVLHGKLCDLFRSGVSAVTGDPMRSLLDAIDAGRKVLDAKTAKGCRFNGAEVDRLVARELRQIAEAAERAKVNLAQALEVMDTT